MACLVLHNILYSMRDDETWLQEDIDRRKAASEREGTVENDIDGNEQEHESNTEAKRVGIIRRDELCNLVMI